MAIPGAKEQEALKLAKEVRNQIIARPQYGAFHSIHFDGHGSNSNRSIRVRAYVET
jgi:hypothetical protein